MPQVICPVCGESSAYSPGSASSIACPRCGSSFSEHEATLIDSAAALSSFLDSAGVTEALPADAEPSRSLPDIPGYDVLEFVARGGMGVVLKARHLALKRLVAIKMPLPHQALDAHSRERFVREARAAANLRHPNICPIHDVGEVAGRPYIAMAFIAGDTLRDWAKRQLPSPRQAAAARRGPLGRMPHSGCGWPPAAEMVAAIARAVHHAHEHGVVHRDIKPGNIMVDSETGQPILTDFGLAKDLADEGVEVTWTGQVIGTPAYMAPEQAAGHTGRIGPPTDIYALGAVLYELLCNRPPFLGGKMELLMKVQTEEPVAPRKLNPRIHRDLETICLKALAKEPAHRYASALAMAEDLDRFCAGEAILARPQGLASKLARKLRRNRLSAAAMLVALLAVAAVAYFALRASHTRRVAALLQSFDAGLEASDWTPEHLAAEEALLSELSRLTLDQATVARQRLLQRLAEAIGESLRRPTLHAEDIRGIERSLELLAARDAGAAAALREQLHRRLRVWQPLFSLEPPFAGLEAVFDRGTVRGDGKGSLIRADAKTPELLTRVPCGVSVQLEAIFDTSWETVPELGLALNASKENAYVFRLRATEPLEPVAGDQAEAKPPTFASARAKGGFIQVEIARNRARIKDQSIEAAKIPPGPLRLVARREGNQLSLQLNSLPPTASEDVFPIRGNAPGVFGLHWPGAVRLTRLRGLSQALPIAPSPLERGDDLYARDQFAEALAFYQEQEIASSDTQVVQEARYKQGLCLIGLQRNDAAAQALERLAAETGGRWPVLAACQLWALRIRQNRMADADVIYESLAARYPFERLAALVPSDLRTQIVDSYRRDVTYFHLFLAPSPNKIRNFERVFAIEESLGTDGIGLVYAKHNLLRAYMGAGQLDAATRLLQGLRNTCPNDDMLCMDHAWLLRLKGDARRALTVVDSLLFEAPGVHRKPHLPLLVERARVHAALEDWDAAERDLDELFARCEPRSLIYRDYSAACLIRGFLRERRGDAAGAIEAWRQGTAKHYYAQPEMPPASGAFGRVRGSGMGLLHAGILPSLTGDFTDAEVGELTAAVLATHMAGSPLARFEGTLGIPPSVVRELWRSPRGRDCARKIAFQTVPLTDFMRFPVLLTLSELVHQGAMPDGMTPEEDAIVWKLGDDCFAAVANSKLLFPQVVQCGLAWKGTTNFLGWAGVAPGLDPQLRGPVAYILGRRYLRLKRPEDARAFFRTALADAPPDSPLRRLAQAQLGRLDAK